MSTGAGPIASSSGGGSAAAAAAGGAATNMEERHASAGADGDVEMSTDGESG